MEGQSVDMFDKADSAVVVFQAELHNSVLGVPDDGGTDIIAPQVVGSGNSVNDEWFGIYFKFGSTEFKKNCIQNVYDITATNLKQVVWIMKTISGWQHPGSLCA